MKLAPIFLLVCVAALAAAESFTLTAYAPLARDIHGRQINASGRRFLVGLDAPSSYCPPVPQIVCPPGTTTTVDEDFAHLRVRPASFNPLPSAPAPCLLLLAGKLPAPLSFSGPD